MCACVWNRKRIFEQILSDKGENEMRLTDEGMGGWTDRWMGGRMGEQVSCSRALEAAADSSSSWPPCSALPVAAPDWSPLDFLGDGQLVVFT